MTKFSVISGSTFNRDVPLISQAFSEPYKLRQKNYMEIDGDWMGQAKLGINDLLAY